MYWGWKSRFHDLDEVIKFDPHLVEFHLTDEDVENGGLNGEIYTTDYSIHLPEYWHQIIIDPCDLDNVQHSLGAYTKCIQKGLSLRSKFNFIGRLKVIMHPGGMSIDPLNSEIHPIKHYKNDLYHRLNSFLNYIEMIPAFKDVEILVENMPPLPWFFGGQYYSNIFCDPEEIAKFCVFANRNICLDISHLGLYCNYVKRDLIEAIKYLKPYTKQIHLADAQGTDGEGAPFGRGNIDFKAVINEIKDMNCAVIPETMWGHKDNYKEFTRMIKECNRWLI